MSTAWTFVVLYWNLDRKSKTSGNKLPWLLTEFYLYSFYSHSLCTQLFYCLEMNIITEQFVWSPDPDEVFLVHMAIFWIGNQGDHCMRHQHPLRDFCSLWLMELSTKVYDKHDEYQAYGVYIWLLSSSVCSMYDEGNYTHEQVEHIYELEKLKLKIYFMSFVDMYIMYPISPHIIRFDNITLSNVGRLFLFLYIDTCKICKI